MQIVGAAASLAIGIISGGKQRDAYRSAADESQEIADRNAQRIEAETHEQTRQARAEQREERARFQAAAGASGALVDSPSHQKYGQGLWDAADREIDWIGRSGSSRSRIARSEGDYAADTANARGDAAWWSSVGSGASNALSFF